MSKLTEFLDFIQPYILNTDMIIIHALIVVPFIYILINFLNRGCDVADSAGLYEKGKNKDSDDDDDEEEGNQKKESFFESRRVGIALMFLAFFWQVHAVWIVADRYLRFGWGAEILSIEKYLSNPNAAQGFHGMFVFALSKALHAFMFNFVKYLYIIHATGCVGFLVCCIVIWKRAADERNQYSAVTTHKKYIKTFFPQGGKEKEAQDYLNAKTDTTRISFCSRCCTPIVGRDHHCRWLGTCIGATSRIPYILSLVFGCLFSTADVLLGTATMLILNDPATAEKLGDVTVDKYYILAGYLFSIAAAAFLVWQMGVQLNLWRVGQTKLGRKGRREAFEMKKEKERLKKDM